MITDTTQPSQWQKAWASKTTPWDAKQPQPALIELLESKQGDLPASGTAIVPGCGTGYDAWLLASRYDVTGIDVVEEAISKAHEVRLAELLNSRTQWAATQANPAHKLDLRVGDFFDPALGQFDVAFDYTFSCAFSPDNRARIGKRYGELVKPGGRLIALQFPLEDRPGGPPFAFSLAQYDEMYSEWFERIPVDVKASMPSRANKEEMSVWRRR